jgi:Asp-tRNA(Asn)/Glu-tRNA(Gln) amidotransferase C subunit
MLDKKELHHLQKLACIRLTADEEKKLWKQLENIIQFLGQLDQIKIGKMADKKWELTLRTISGVKKFPHPEKLLKNVKHPIVNNSIVIKSVLS